MLPDPHDKPIVVAEACVDLTIAGDVAVELRSPIRAICSRLSCMNWAPVPEATIHEDRHPCSRECDVGHNRRRERDSVLGPVPKPRGVKGLAEPHFRTGVRLPVPLHDGPDRQARGARGNQSRGCGQSRAHLVTSSH
jgi:hypothetical protein